MQCRRPGFDPLVRKITWGREWLPTVVLLPGKSHGQKRLAGFSSWACECWTWWCDFRFQMLIYVWYIEYSYVNISYIWCTLYMKSSRIYHLIYASWGIKIILSWMFFRRSRHRKRSKNSRIYTLVRETYIYKRTIHLKMFPSVYQKEENDCKWKEL